jgi:hypothetical protein
MTGSIGSVSNMSCSQMVLMRSHYCCFLMVFIVLVKTVRCHWCSPKHELYWVLEAALAAEASGEQLEKFGPLCLVGASQIVSDTIVSLLNMHF